MATPSNSTCRDRSPAAFLDNPSTPPNTSCVASLPQLACPLRQAVGVKRISHWVGGKLVPGTSGRSGPVYDPATGVQTGEVDFASAAEVGAAVDGSRGRVRRVALGVALPTRRGLFRFRELRRRATATTSARADHRRARQGARPTPGRGRARPRVRRVRVRDPAPPQGLAQPRGVDRHRRAHDPSAGGRRRRHHAVQLPGDGAAVDARRTRSRAATRSCSSRPRRIRRRRCCSPSWCSEAGFPDGVLQRRAGRSPRRWTRSSTHPGIDAVSFVGSTPIARHVYETGTTHGKRVQALGGAKNHMVVLPDADVDAAADAAISAAYGSAGERCMAISVVVAVGDGRRPAGRRDRGADPRARGRARRPIADIDDGTAHHPRAPRPGAVVRRQRPPTRVPTVVVDGHPARSDGDGFFVGVSLLDNVEPGMAVYDDEIFGPVLSVVRVADLRRGRRARQREPLRQRRRAVHPRRRRRPSVRARGASRDGRHQRADPGARRVALASAVGRRRCSATAHVRPRGHPLLHPRRRSSPRDGPIPRRADRPRLPRTR